MFCLRLQKLRRNAAKSGCLAVLGNLLRLIRLSGVNFFLWSNSHDDTDFDGQNFGYCYEAETGHYLLHDEEFRNYIYLQGDDALMFREQLEHIDKRNDSEGKTVLLKENAISIYL
jgi:hypothetical protein